MNIINFNSPIIPVTDNNSVADMDTTEKTSRKKKATDAPPSPENTPQNKKQKKDSEQAAAHSENPPAAAPSDTPTLVQRILDDTTLSLDNLCRRGCELEDMEKYKEAIQIFNKVLQSGGYPPLIYKCRSRCYYKLDMWDNAIQDITLSLNIVPKDFEARLHRASVFYRLGRNHEALTDIEAAEKISPLDESWLGIKSSCEVQTKDLPIAFETANKVLRINPKNEEVLALRAKIYYLQNKDQEALRDLTEALTLSPNFIRALSYRSSVYFKLGMYQNVINDISRLIATGQTNYSEFPKALFRRAQAYAKLNKIDQATTDCNEVLRLDPTYIESSQLRDSLKKV